MAQVLDDKKRLEIFESVLANEENSLETICNMVQLSPMGFWKFREKHGLDLPDDIIPFRYDSEIDQLIDEKLTLRENAKKIKKSKETVRKYFQASGLYKIWKKQNQNRQLKKQTLKKQKKNCTINLISILKTRVNELAKYETWPVQKALEYKTSLKHNGSNLVAYDKLVKLFEIYEFAQKSNTKLSLEEIGNDLRLSPTHIGVILKKVGLKPLYGNVKQIRYSKEEISLIKKLFAFEMNNSDLAYFLGLNPYNLSQFRRRNGVKTNSKNHICRTKFKILNYRLASQIYHAQDLFKIEGITRSQIGDLLDTEKKIVDYAIQNKAVIAPKIIDVLKTAYGDHMTKPYKESSKQQLIHSKL
jgi:hypothetical protein